jgi:hypothetical protein
MNNQKSTEKINENQQPGPSSQTDKKHSRDDDPQELTPLNQVLIAEEIDYLHAIEPVGNPIRAIPANKRMIIFSPTEMRLYSFIFIMLLLILVALCILLGVKYFDCIEHSNKLIDRINSLKN